MQDMNPINSSQNIVNSLEQVGAIPSNQQLTNKSSNQQTKIEDFNTQSSINSPKLKIPKQKSPEINNPELDIQKHTQDPMPDLSGTIKSTNKIFSSISVGKGLGLAFFILIVLIWLVIPTASGYTRMQLLWFTIIGQTKLQSDGKSNVIPEPNSTIPGSTQQNQPSTQVSGPDLSQVNVSNHNDIIDYDALNTIEF